jgi:hypothetical protein
VDRQKYTTISILTTDNNILEERLSRRYGTTKMGLIHEIILKTEPQPRRSGKFISREEIDA